MSFPPEGDTDREDGAALFAVEKTSDRRVHHRAHHPEGVVISGLERRAQDDVVAWQRGARMADELHAGQETCANTKRKDLGHYSERNPESLQREESRVTTERGNLSH